MYFYTVSDGCYSDYSHTTMYHEKKFTNKEFTKMYNEAINNCSTKYHYHDEIAEKMSELFGFVVVEVEFEIGVDYGSHKVVDIESIDEDVKYYHEKGI